ncbi:MAG: hypothetical protein M1840_008151 [Geoglossum simile]|nr:MAG: hypothetical protein M1840_008151 [Geoglossum simile]
MCGNISGDFFYSKIQESIEIFGGPQAIKDFENAAQSRCRLCVLLRDDFRRRSYVHKVPLYGPLSITIKSTTLPCHPVETRHALVLQDAKGEELAKLQLYLDPDPGLKLGEMQYKANGVPQPPPPGVRFPGSTPGGNRAVNSDAQCVENVMMATSWLKECDKNHNSCRWDIAGSKNFHPSRLLNIGSSCIRLDCTSRSHAAPYIALSHCWGTKLNALVPKTTSLNLKERMRKIPTTELSKTFQDTVAFTRQLGIDFIWIDSLCIIQDDAEDFKREAQQMHLVYSHALLTIAASDAESGDDGLFLPRNPLSITPYTFFGEQLGNSMDRQSACATVIPNFGDWMKSTMGSLQLRGWTLQERHLSLRIIHFSKNRILWECRESVASEDHPEMLQKWYNDQLSSSDHSKRFTDFDRKPWDHDILGHWHTLIHDYSARDLTFKSDKLPALSGLAAFIRTLRPNWTYLAGIWEEALLTSLTWNAVSFKGRLPSSADEWPPPTVDGIPSWSWASYDGIINSGTRQAWHDQFAMVSGQNPPVQVLETWTDASESDCFGRVHRGFIKLKSKVIEVEVSEVQRDKSDYLPFKHKNPKPYNLFEIGYSRTAIMSSQKYSIRLSTPSNWDIWIDMIKNKAKAAVIWKYINPSIAATNIPEFMRLVMPQLKDINPAKL